MTRFLLPIIASLGLLTLAGCGGGTPNDDLARNCTVDRTKVERFSLCLPDNWTHTTEQFGGQGSFVVYINAGEEENSLMRMHVKKDPLEEEVPSSMALAKRAVEISQKSAPEYSPVSVKPVIIDTTETILHEFYATPNPDAGPVHYYQYIVINEGIVYGFTGVVFAEEDEKLLELLMDVFTNVQFV